jgi:hypothetical protein
VRSRGACGESLTGDVANTIVKKGLTRGMEYLT